MAKAKTSRSELIKDFKIWSGGWGPEECDEHQISVYLDYARPNTLTREKAKQMLEGGKM
jgi:hypothetical protein